MVGRRHNRAATPKSVYLVLEGHARLAWRALALYAGSQLLVLLLTGLNDLLGARRANGEIPVGLIAALPYLAIPLWFYAAVKVVTLFTAWVTHEVRPPNLTAWGIGAFGILLALPFSIHGLAAPVSAIRLTDTCMANQKKIMQALQAHDNYDPVLPLAWTADANLRAAWLSCPGTQRRFHARGGYGMNFYIVGKRVGEIADPRRTVMIADSVAPGSLLYTMEDIDRTRHLGRGGRAYLCGFIDGHVEWYRTGDVLELRQP